MDNGVLEPKRGERVSGHEGDEVAPVWVLDDPGDSYSRQAVGIAERLGVPHLRVNLAWRWAAPVAGLLTGRGSLHGLRPGSAHGWPFTAPQGPALTVGAGRRAEAVASWLRARFGCRVVQCTRPHWGLHASAFDLLVMPEEERLPQAANVLPILGVTHRVSPLVLAQARVAWAGRLAHMPRPLIALLVGSGPLGAPMRPHVALALARRVAAMAAAAGGSVMATTSPGTGPKATEAIADGLSSGINMLYRWGEPGPNPYEGLLGLADAIVVTGGATSMISEACSGEAPVFIAAQDDGPRQAALQDAFYAAGHARPLRDSLLPWRRRPLDETGRVAAEIRARMSIGPHGVD